MTLSTSFEVLPVTFDVSSGKYYNMVEKGKKLKKKKRKKELTFGPDIYFAGSLE